MRFRLPWQKRKEKDCEWVNFCTNCDTPWERDRCELCKQYRFIDSGYGWCNLLPKPYLVSWCKLPCSWFGPRKPKEFPA